MDTQEQIPSPFQEAIYDFVEFGKGNAVVDACAGSGKTTTIVKALKKIPETDDTIFLAFNKSIIGELKSRAPKHVEVSTLHSLGWSILRRYFDKPVLNNNKVYEIIQSLKDEWFMDERNSGEDSSMDSDYLNRVSKLVDLAKTCVISDAKALEDIAEKYSIEITNGEPVKAIEVLKLSYKDTKTFDYNDMIFVPAVHPKITCPIYKWVLVDEVQDLNKSQQKLLFRILGPESRFIAVGDPHQAIYGFAGADIESFRNLQNFPNTITLPLSVCYRCPESHIELAQGIVPSIQAAPGAKRGIIELNASETNIEDGDMVLCRNTAPLVKLCLEKISKGIKAYVKGGDIGKNLINFVKKTKAKSLDQLYDKFDQDQDKVFNKLKLKNPKLDDEKIKELSTYRIYLEKIQVIKLISFDPSVKNCESLINKIVQIFADEKSGICFSTIHKAKGLESTRVHIIDQQLMPSKWAKKDWEQEQEANLRYVAFTRSKHYLGFITDWSFYQTDKEERESQALKVEDYE